MLGAEDFVATLHYEPVLRVLKPSAHIVCVGDGFLKDGIRLDHLPRDQIMTVIEVFERTLSLRSPQLVTWYIDLTQAICLFAKTPASTSFTRASGPNCVFSPSLKMNLALGAPSGDP